MLPREVGDPGLNAHRSDHTAHRGVEMKMTVSYKHNNNLHPQGLTATLRLYFTI